MASFILVLVFVFLFISSFQNILSVHISEELTAEAALIGSDVFNSSPLTVSSLGATQTVLVDSSAADKVNINNAAKEKMGVQNEWGSDTWTNNNIDENGRWKLEGDGQNGKRVIVWARFQLDDDLVNIRRSGSLYITYNVEYMSLGSGDMLRSGIGVAGLTDSAISTSSTWQSTTSLVSSEVDAAENFFGAFWSTDNSMPTVTGTVTSNNTSADYYLYIMFFATGDGNVCFGVENMRFVLSYQTGNAVKANENHSKVGGVTPSSIGSLGDAEYVKNATSGTYTDLGNSATNLSFDAYNDYFYLRVDEIVTGYRFVGWLETTSSSPPAADMDKADFTYTTTLAAARTEIQSKISGFVSWHNGTSASGYNTFKIGRVADSGNTRIIGGHNITAVYVPLQYEVRFAKSGTTEEYD